VSGFGGGTGARVPCTTKEGKRAKHFYDGNQKIIKAINPIGTIGKWGKEYVPIGLMRGGRSLKDVGRTHKLFLGKNYRVVEIGVKKKKGSLTNINEDKAFKKIKYNSSTGTRMSGHPNARQKY